jgi:DNA repair exonuclease SbcCD ATPase subunit
MEIIMARPLGAPESFHSTVNGAFAGRPVDPYETSSAVRPPLRGYVPAVPIDPYEFQSLQAENSQLRHLCAELEQALNEASQHGNGWEEKVQEYETLLEDKTRTIQELTEQLAQAQRLTAELETQLAEATAGPAPTANGQLPRESELLALSEELERERRQLQEDEETLMAQMREMEVGMARERAEIARQRNDLQRLQSEIHHEIERLEKNGAIQSKIDALKVRLQDATARRGAAPAPAMGSRTQQSSTPQTGPNQSTPLPENRSGFIGRLFGGK